MIVAQISDLHVMREDRLAYGALDTQACLQRAIGRLNDLAPRPDVVAITGDLVDEGSAREYARLRGCLDGLRLPYRLVPGNHDARGPLREAFPEQPWDDAEPGFCLFAEEFGDVLVVGLDSLDPGRTAGRLCARRLAWLDRVLAARAGRPSLVMVHHPPFATGIAHLDGLPLAGAQEMLEIAARHGGVQRVVAGHVHRSMGAQPLGVACTTCPSTAHHFALDLEPGMRARWIPEPPGFQLHLLAPGTAPVTHTGFIEDYGARPTKP